MVFNEWKETDTLVIDFELVGFLFFCFWYYLDFENDERVH